MSSEVSSPQRKQLCNPGLSANWEETAPETGRRGGEGGQGGCVPFLHSHPPLPTVGRKPGPAAGLETHGWSWNEGSCSLHYSSDNTAIPSLVVVTSRPESRGNINLSFFITIATKLLWDGHNSTIIRGTPTPCLVVLY